MRRISLIGSGWLGSALINRLKSSYTLNVSTTKKEKIKLIDTSNVKAFLVDVENIEKNILEFLDSEILIINITSKNINAFRNLIIQIEKSLVKKIIFTSSTSVYSKKNNLLEIEKLFLSNTNFQTTILRLGGLIGPKRHPANFFKDKFIKNANSSVNLVHQVDVLNAIEFIIDNNLWNETFNIVASTHPSKKEFYGFNMEKLNYNYQIDTKEENEPSKIVNNSKIKRAGFKFIHDDLMKLDPLVDYK